MTRSMPIIEARRRLTTLPEDFKREPEAGAVAVTRRGKPVLAVIPWELYESIIETMEIMGDAKLMAALRRGIIEIQEERGIPWKQAREKLGL